MTLEKIQSSLGLIRLSQSTDAQSVKFGDFLRVQLKVFGKCLAHSPRGDKSEGLFIRIEDGERAAHDAKRALHKMQSCSHLLVEVARVGYLLTQIGQGSEGVEKLLQRRALFHALKDQCPAALCVEANSLSVTSASCSSLASATWRVRPSISKSWTV